MDQRSDQHEVNVDADIATAAQWYASLRGDSAGEPLRAQFGQWLATSPRHRLAYADVCAAALAVESLPVDDIVLLPPPRRRATRALRGWIGGTFAALLAIAAVWNFDGIRLHLQADHSTLVGEQRDLLLDDGTRVILGADSALRIRFDDAGRQVDLLRGSADFNVVADPARPFAVHAGALSATAIGTRYSVRWLPAQPPRVEVEHGRVRVEVDGVTITTLEAGQRTLQRDGDWQLEASAGEGAALRDGLLVFDGEPLHYVLAALGSYIDGELRVSGGARLDTPITAAIPAEDAQAALHSLASRYGLRVRTLPMIGVLVY